jgi:hypothetical protein
VQGGLSLPNARPRAQWARHRHDPDHRPISHAVIRVGLSAVIVASFLTAPDLTAPRSVEAAGCTNHRSKVHPPDTINVLRTRTGKVQTVDFRRYVATVMASGEWPTYLPMAALEAGAVATKQYAWYYTLKRNHRSGFRSAKGACYDVRDDVTDQLYRPEQARPTRKQFEAIDDTWGLSLRKGGRFFLTGYRAGTRRRCASDADGWKLYARSVINCASKKDWSRERIQEAYYGPSLEYVWAPGSQGPEVSTPRIRLTRRSSLYAAFAKVSWHAQGGRHEPRSTRFRLEHRIAGGKWKRVQLTQRNATSAHVDLSAEKSHKFRVRAKRRDEGRGSWSTSDRTRVQLRGANRDAEFGQRVILADERGDRARVRFDGRSIALIAPLGPRMGRAEIKLNGRVVAKVDLERGKRKEKKLVWTRNWSREKVRRIVVQPARKSDRLRIDGFLVLR